MHAVRVISMIDLVGPNQNPGPPGRVHLAPGSGRFVRSVHQRGTTLRIIDEFLGLGNGLVGGLHVSTVQKAAQVTLRLGHPSMDF